MGNLESNNTKITDFYKEVSKCQHPTLGNIVRLSPLAEKHTDTPSHIQQVYLMKETRCSHEQIFKELVDRSKKRKIVSNKKGAKNILKLMDISMDQKNQLCGITYYCYCMYQNFTHDVSEIIGLRSKQHNNFSQYQLIQFLYGICNGLIFLNDYNLKNHSINKYSIVYDSNSKVYKILDNHIHQEMHPYTKIINGIPIQKGIYLSPELMEDALLKVNEPEALYSPKSDIFSLGVLLLEMCSLSPMDHFYDYQNNSIDSQGLHATINNISYSEYFKSLLRSMLSLCEDERIGFLSIKQKLSTYDDCFSHTQSTVPIDSQLQHEIGRNSAITQRTVKNPPLPQYSNLPHGNYSTQPYISFNQVQQQHSNHQHFIMAQPALNRLPPQILHYPLTEYPKFQQITPSNYNEQLHQMTSLEPRRPLSPLNKPYKTEQRGQIRSRAISFNLQNSSKPIRQFDNRYENEDVNHSIGYVEKVEKEVKIEKGEKVSNFQQMAHTNQIAESWNNKNTVLTSLDIIPPNKEQNKCQTPSKPPKFDLTYSSKSQQQPKSGENTPIRKIQALQQTVCKKRGTIVEILNEISEEDKSENQNEDDDNLVPIRYGQHHFANGAVYQGEFDRKANFCGSGVLYYPNSRMCYSGNWVNNCFHGFGVLYNEQSPDFKIEEHSATIYQNFSLNNQNSWQRYEGEFKMDKKDGFGKLYMKNGDKFCGSFINDVIEGYGTFTSKVGKIVSGLWSDNILKKL